MADNHDGECRQAQPQLTSQSEVGVAIKEEYELSKPVCRLCSKSFVNGSVLNRHLKNIHHLDSAHSEFGPWGCERCHKSFKRRGDLARHKCNTRREPTSTQRKRCSQAGKKERNILCEYEGCEYRCGGLAELKRHSCKHTGAKEFICTYCCKGFVRKEVLEIHVRTHILEKPFKCTVTECEYQSHRKDLLSLHIWSKHPSLRSTLGSKTRPLAPLYIPCPFCKQAVQKIALEVHLRTHTNERPFPCEFCDYRAKILPSLREHIIRMHNSGESEFTCTQCGKVYRTEGDLRQHVLHAHVNSGIPGRYVKCTICPSKIIRDHALRRQYFVKHGMDLSVYVVLSKCDAEIK